jgi:DNA-binding transcriptional ArsR family regulator
MVQYSAARISEEALSKVADAISDRTRRSILVRLARGPASISDVAEPFGMTLTGVCKHVRVLERAGLVRRRRHGREKILEFSPAPLGEVARWIHPYESFWNGRMNALESHFAAKKEKMR